MPEVKPFAKLYETAELGQVLVKLDTSEESTPEVRFYVAPPTLGVCSFAWSWADSDDGWDKAEAAFAAVDEAKAVEVGQMVMRQAGQFTEATHD